MISTFFTFVYTNRGWVSPEELMWGDRVVSFNPERGVCEYDKVYGIQLDYKQCSGLGIRSNTMRSLLTPEHPLMIWDNKKKKLTRTPIKEVFMSKYNYGRPTSILAHRLFEPYRRTQDMDDIRWSARIAATFSNARHAFVPEQHMVDDLGGLEAQAWLETFFHWNRKLPGVNWQGTVRLGNRQVRDMLFNIGWRAGVGVKWRRPRKSYAVSITNHGDATPYADSGWMSHQIDGLVFNVSTKNGNVLMRSYNGTYLMACEYGGVYATAVS